MLSNIFNVLIVIIYMTTICTDGIILVSSSPRRVVKELKVTNGDGWGSWKDPDFCAEDSYAVGYSMKLETDQGAGLLRGGDDTSMNAVKLRCGSLDGNKYGGDITSGQGGWGAWSIMTTCSNDPNHNEHHFLTSFALQVEPDVGGSKDDTAANYIKFRCRDFEGTVTPYDLVKAPGHGLWGSFGSYSASCDDNSAICGIQTRVEGPQGGHDDTSLNDVIFYCCEQ